MGGGDLKNAMLACVFIAVLLLAFLPVVTASCALGDETYGCKSGQYCSELGPRWRTQGECVSCLPGHYCEGVLENEQPVGPKKCPPGKYSPSRGLSACAECSEGLSSEWGSTKCVESNIESNVPPAPTLPPSDNGRRRNAPTPPTPGGGSHDGGKNPDVKPPTMMPSRSDSGHDAGSKPSAFPSAEKTRFPTNSPTIEGGGGNNSGGGDEDPPKPTLPPSPGPIDDDDNPANNGNGNGTDSGGGGGGGRGTCGKGTYYDSRMGCVACGAGTFSAKGGCTPCKAGTFSAFMSDKCWPCDEGFFAQMGQASCTMCPSGTFSSKGAAACSPCKDGTYSSPGAAKCDQCDDSSKK